MKRAWKRERFKRLLRYVRGLSVGGLALLSLSPATGAEPFLREPIVARAARPDGAPLFEELLPADTGVDFLQPIDTNHPQKCLYVGGYASPGIAMGDLNGDGLADLFLTGGPVSNRLYLQKPAPDGSASLEFRDASDLLGDQGRDDWSAGVTFVDIDGDRDLDIYVCNYDAPNQLFINEPHADGSLRLIESAKAYGLDLKDASFIAAFSDYDGDGDLDVLVGAYQYVNPAGRPAEPPVVKNGDQYSVLPEFQKYYGIVRDSNGRQTFTNVGRANYLLQSNAAQAEGGPIRFTDVTKPAGISGVGVCNSLLWWDFDADGLPDIYVGNDFKVADQLFHNNGDGTFTEVIKYVFPHTTWFSMGSEAGDINNDGLLDLFVSDMAGTTHYRSKVTMGEMSVHKEFMKTAEPRQYMRNALLLNTGTTRFLEAAYMTGLAKSDWSWAVKLADFDNDGRIDSYITNGAARMFNHSDRNFTDQQRVGKTQWDLWEDTEPRNEENLAFQNLGDLKFKNVSEAWGLRKDGMSYAAATGDLDNDGDMDLVVANLEQPISIYRNGSSEGHRIRVKLNGAGTNTFGIGATVQVTTAAGQKQVRQLSPSMGFLSCNDPVLHFGLGDADRIDEMTVQWPSGQQQILRVLEADYTYTVVEPAAPTSSTMATSKKTNVRAASPRPLFVPSRRFPALKHTEIEFDDYARQPLLPYTHSQLGPGLAVGDVDGDGDFDFYLGRAKGARRAVYRNAGAGRLEVAQVFDEVEAEDLGALFFDADRDGDRDLYVVSGSVECEPNDPSLRDRLYLNDGKGSFAEAADALPDVRQSGSVVCAADYDRDGDLDLFVGGRVVPGQYPISPKSQLLGNDSESGKLGFSDRTAKVAPGLEEVGLVTSAVWSDVDGDGWVDLMVTLEWGPVRFFHNEADTSSRVLVDRTNDAGLHTRLGWWNGIAAADLDQDGDTDYVVTNFGLNTQYKASDEKPELIYFGQFDDSGRSRLLEAKFEADKCFPRRGLSCSSHAMPFVREKVKTFHQFGLSTLEEIYSKEKLNESLQLSANCLETGILINLSEQGQTAFRFQTLPRIAQISPSFGVSIGDFNADGMPDIFLAQNFFSPQHETGRMDSGLGQVLLGTGVGGDGDLGFHAAWPRESGILIPGDAKATSLVDFNRDGWADLLVTVNNGPLQAYEAVPHLKNQLFRVKLLGQPGNLDCVGAKVTLNFEGSERRPTQEVVAGGGYLSQTTSILSFGIGPSGPSSVTVQWPDGSQREYPVKVGQRSLAIRSGGG